MGAHGAEPSALNGCPRPARYHVHMSSRHLTRDPRDWIGLAARLILGGALGWAGLTKVGNLDGNVAQVELYRLPIPHAPEVVIGTAQPIVEIVVGLLLIVGLFTRVSGALGALAMIAFIGGITWAWANGLNIDCGCFSAGGELPEGEEPTYLIDILRDIGFAACGIWLWVRPRSPFALDSVLFRPIDEGNYG